jgi:hypothetical protein
MEVMEIVDECSAVVISNHLFIHLCQPQGTGYSQSLHHCSGCMCDAEQHRAKYSRVTDELSQEQTLGLCKDPKSGSPGFWLESQLYLCTCNFLEPFWICALHLYDERTRVVSSPLSLRSVQL